MMLLTLFLEKLEINGPESKRAFINNPADAEQFDGFQHLLKQLIGQGLAMEEIFLTHNYGPELHFKHPPALEQILSARKENMMLKQLSGQRYQLVEVVESARFCFRRPQEPLFKQAQCAQSATSKTFDITDPLFFGSTQGGKISFEAADFGSIALYTRSLAEMFDYLGKLVRAAQEAEFRPKVKTAAGDQPLIAILPAWKTSSAAVTAEFNGTRYAIPAGKAAGYSGAVLSIITQLLAQAQSIKNRPASNVFTFF